MLNNIRTEKMLKNLNFSSGHHCPDWHGNTENRANTYYKPFISPLNVNLVIDKSLAKNQIDISINSRKQNVSFKAGLTTEMKEQIQHSDISEISNRLQHGKQKTMQQTDLESMLRDLNKLLL